MIICARNEAQNLKENLPSVLEQDHDAFEVVVVNDSSTDESSMVLEELKQKFRHLTVTTITDSEKSFPGKKGALEKGIAAAKYDHFVLTDADCKPASGEWLTKMSSPLSAGFDLVLGISPYYPGKGTVNALVRYETMLTAIQYAGLALFNKPYMGVGRNMAYTRDLYYEVRGFEGLAATLSGDDDLFVQKAIDHATVEVVLDENAFTWSRAPESYSGLLRQKKRHYSTGKHYRPSSLLPIGIFTSAKIVFWLTFVIALLNFFWQTLGVLILFHILCSIMAWPLALKHKTEDILWKFPLLDLLYIATAAISGSQATRNGNYKWK